MSVHSEYSRAVEAMLDRLQALDHPKTETWIENLKAARVGSHPDLSSAARSALTVLMEIEADSTARSVAGLIELRERLHLHCQFILGN